MYGLAQLWEEAKYDVHALLRLHRIVKDLGMDKEDIINVLEFVKHNQLRTLQWKAVYLRYQINKLETEKMEAMNQIFKLKRMIPELEETLAQKRKEMAQMNQESTEEKYDNTGNLYSVPYSEHSQNLHCIPNLSLTYRSALIAVKCSSGNKKIILGTASMEIKSSSFLLQQLISIALLEVIRIPLFNSVLIRRSRDGKEMFSELTMTSEK